MKVTAGIPFCSRFSAALLVAGLFASSLWAAPKVFFPTGIDVPAVLGNQKLAQLGVVDVTAKPFEADRSGQRDSTAELQKAIEFARDKRMVAFFPLGTYRISNTLTAVKSVDRMYPCLLVGERRPSAQDNAARPVILLAPHSPGFSDPAHPKCVVNFWSRGYGNDLTKVKVVPTNNSVLVRRQALARFAAQASRE
jgi:hypothetical protein